VSDALHIELDRVGEVPLGVQLAWALRMRILAGQLRPGERLPGVRELAAATAVNVNTVRSVYARLEADGLARAEHGRGTFVAQDAPVDDRLAEVARGALEAARTAGLDPREVAAALYSRIGPAAAPEPAPQPPTAALRRRALRDEIAALERELADARLARALRDDVRNPPRSPGARLLGEDELLALRDDLVDRLRAVQRPAPETPAPPPASTRSSTRPQRVVHFRPSLGT
jgi:DNA-binding transcriptional regulator YhcF (GntR family)